MTTSFCSPYEMNDGFPCPREMRAVYLFYTEEAEGGCCSREVVREEIGYCKIGETPIAGGSVFIDCRSLSGPNCSDCPGYDKTIISCETIDINDERHKKRLDDIFLSKENRGAYCPNCGEKIISEAEDMADGAEPDMKNLIVKYTCCHCGYVVRAKPFS